MGDLILPVIPAKAGIQTESVKGSWIPFADMTENGR
jgi:hypothetical protein